MQQTSNQAPGRKKRGGWGQAAAGQAMLDDSSGSFNLGARDSDAAEMLLMESGRESNELLLRDNSTFAEPSQIRVDTKP